MTRTARSGKKEPLAATPWEKLREEQSNQNQSENGDRTGEEDNLKVTRKRKLGPKLSKKAKTQLKRLTGTTLKRTFSDSVKLIDSTDHSGSLLESANVPETRTRLKPTRTKGNKTRKKALKDCTTTTGDGKEAARRGKKKKSEVLLKNLRRKKRKRESEEERVGHSDSLSEQGEAGESGSGECEDGESGSGECERWEQSDSGPGELGEVEEEEKERVAKRNKRVKNTFSRVKIGNRWVKAGNTRSTVEERGGGGGQEVEGSGSKVKRKRPMDEESKRKRIEHRRLRRQRKKVCFNCRQPGHWLGDCPLAAASSSSSSAGICFKCGSSEHSCQQCQVKVPSGEFPYAKCFICGEMGHLTRSCPDNPRGLYPRGGGCKICGSVEHLRANCPDGKMSAGTTKSTTDSGQQGAQFIANSKSADALDNVTAPPVRKKIKNKAKIVKFWQ